MAFFEQTKLTNSSGTVINPAEKQELYAFDPPVDTPAPVVRTAPGSVDDQLALLRRIAKVLESTAAADTAQRQRVTIDAGTLPTVTTVGTVTTVTGVTTVTTVATVTSVTNIAAMAGWNQNMFADPARTAYNTGIRARLTFG